MNDFYTVHDLQQEEGKLSCKVTFNAEHDIFKGHFPGQPVVPGVCMMELSKELLEQQTGKQLMLQDAGNVKFLQLITPGTSPEVHITWTKDAENYKVNTQFKDGENILLKLNGSYSILTAL